MKKNILTLAIGILLSGSLFAQTEISGYADSDATDGINTAAQQYTIDEAVAYCRDLVEDSKNDWYLPSVEELTLFIPDQDLCATSYPGCVSDAAECQFQARYHWTRSNRDAGWACIYTYCSGSNITYQNNSTTALKHVRCVR